jgi:ParD-like antitoxin of type II bacterial toxin-antitoxin system
VSKQIEHWASLGKIAEENPALTIGSMQYVLISIEEVKAGETSEYTFG